MDTPPTAGRYWFLPKRIVGGLAVFYPATLAGVGVTILFFTVGVALFRMIDATSHSGSDTLLGFAPWAIALLAIFDLISFRFGEYPSWWRQAKKKSASAPDPSE